MSAAQNINRLCFHPQGILFEEFSVIFRSLFKNPENHISIVEALSKKGKGLTREELIRASKIPAGGATTRVLDDLEQSNFIRRYNAYGKKRKE